MGDAAQGEPIRHVVFEKPFKVNPVYEMWNTPGRYRDYPGGKELPDKLKVWRVQKTEKTYGGVVSRAWGFNDSPDAEALAPGFNNGKESGAVGVGRHASVLKWGFSAPPSQMTEAGRCFFLNCICYISKFDGKLPLVRREASDRINPVRLAMIMDKINDDEFFERVFPKELFKQYRKDSAGLMKYYQDDFEYIYHDGVYRIDRELKALGIASNRQVASLEKLIALLGDPKQAPTARRLLKRYTAESFETSAEWRAWFEANQGRFYFSDVGGYKFRVVPEGYLE
jgi:hypothetical protein